MATDKSIILQDNTRLKWFIKSHLNYLNKTTIIYGRTNSGKSTIIEEIMYLCKDYIPTVFVIAPTNASNNAYTNKIPDQLIKKEIEVEWLEKLLKRQKNSAGAYIKANKIELLKQIFDKISDTRMNNIEKSIIKRAHESIIYIDKSDMEFIHKKSQRTQILKQRDIMLRKLYKNCIRIHKVQLENDDSLTKTEKCVLSFLDFNPNVLLILDDCASKFKQLYKKSTAIKEIFYEGRHYFFTTIISSQDDKEIDSELRKNTSVSIFTTAQAATSNFERLSNGYPKQDRIKAKLCIDSVFSQDDNTPHHYQKLVYLQGMGEPFVYTIANIFDDFRMCSEPLWDYSNRINEKNEKRADNNPLFDSYT
jgi:hypothetical protein